VPSGRPLADGARVRAERRLVPFEWFVALRYLRDARGQTDADPRGGRDRRERAGVPVGADRRAPGVAHRQDARLAGPRHAAHAARGGRALVEPTPSTAIARLREARPQRLRSIDQWPTVVAQLEATAGRDRGVAQRHRRRLRRPRRRARGRSWSAASTPSGFARSSTSPAAWSRPLRGRRRRRHDRRQAGGRARGRGRRQAAAALERGRRGVVAVRGVFQLGNEAVDATWVVTSLRQAQTLFGLPAGRDHRRAEGRRRVRRRAHRHPTCASAPACAPTRWMTINADLLWASPRSRARRP
jgi:lipoprotein-releasing system permease protein